MSFLCTCRCTQNSRKRQHSKSRSARFCGRDNIDGRETSGSKWNHTESHWTQEICFPIFQWNSRALHRQFNPKTSWTSLLPRRREEQWFSSIVFSAVLGTSTWGTTLGTLGTALCATGVSATQLIYSSISKSQPKLINGHGERMIWTFMKNQQIRLEIRPISEIMTTQPNFNSTTIMEPHTHRK